MEDDVVWYMSGCKPCQHIKPDRTKCAAPLYPHSIPEGPWMTISWDIVGPLPQSRGFDSILVIIDKFMKRTLVEPISFDLTGLGAAWKLHNHVFCNHGILQKIISDRGLQFVSKFMKEFYGMIGITVV